MRAPPVLCLVCLSLPALAGPPKVIAELAATKFVATLGAAKKACR